jgi:dihydropteroate synthase
MKSENVSTRYVFLRRGKLDLSVPAVMGILNVTPDSFFDGGRYRHEEAILIRVERMLEEGAGIIDVGAASTRPGARPVPVMEELLRLLPAITAIRKHFPECILSADTYRATVAEQAVDAGVDLINDIAGGTMDPAMFSTIGRLKVPYVLMHMQGTPDTMNEQPLEAGAVQVLKSFFDEKISLLKEAGVASIILDPGFGFGKSVEANYALLDQLAAFTHGGYPVMAGLSRKSMINKVLGTKPDEALNGTTAANTVALINGASILRVHDVREAVQAVKIVTACKKAAALPPTAG